MVVNVYNGGVGIREVFLDLRLRKPGKEKVSNKLNGPLAINCPVRTWTLQKVQM